MVICNEHSMKSSLQGMIYSDTAADNYGDANLFKQSMHTIPAKRFGIPEEVCIM